MNSTVTKWKFNGLPIDINPTRASTTPIKQVEYRKLPGGREVRIIPPVRPIDMHIVLSWDALTHEWRNRFYDWFINDTRVEVETHLVDNPRDKWTTKIDAFSATPRREFGSVARWLTEMTLTVVEGMNDPIIRHTYDRKQSAFVVQNSTNTTVHDAFIFVHPKSNEKSFFFGGEALGGVMDEESLIDPSLQLDENKTLDANEPVGEFFGYLLGVPYMVSNSTIEKASYVSTPSIDDPVWEEINMDDYMNLYDEGAEVHYTHQGGASLYGTVQAGVFPFGFESTGETVGLKFTVDLNSVDIPVEQLQREVIDLRLDLHGYGYGQSRDEITGELITGYGLAIYAQNFESNSLDLLTITNDSDMAYVRIDKYLFPEDMSHYIDPVEKRAIFVVETLHPAGEAHAAGIRVRQVSGAVSYAYIENLSLRQTYFNLLQNPGFEHKFEHWNCDEEDWKIDIIHSFEGARAARVSKDNSPILQELILPDGLEKLSLMWSMRAYDSAQSKVKLSYYDHLDQHIDDFEHLVAAGADYETQWVTSDVPNRAVRAVFSIEKVSGDTLYVDRLLCRIGGTSESEEPRWTNHAHRTLYINRPISKGEVLTLLTGQRNADINALIPVNDMVSGDYFSFPVGESVIIVEEDSEEVYGEVVVRYDALWT